MSAFEDATASAAENQTQLARGRTRTSVIKVMLLVLGGLMVITWLSNLSNQLTSKPATRPEPVAEVSPTGEPMTLATALRDYKVADAACERASLALERNTGTLQDAIGACGESLRAVSNSPFLYWQSSGSPLQSCVDMEGARFGGLEMLLAIKEHRGDFVSDGMAEAKYRREFHLAAFQCNVDLVKIQREIGATE